MGSRASTRLQIRRAERPDLERLLEIEAACFSSDQLSRRSFCRWLKADHGVFLVAVLDDELCAYGLAWCLSRSPGARMYSLAVQSQVRGQGIAPNLLQQIERACTERQRTWLRLEVAVDNAAAIHLYEKSGYSRFAKRVAYYADGRDAWRMQKSLAPDPAGSV